MNIQINEVKNAEIEKVFKKPQEENTVKLPEVPSENVVQLPEIEEEICCPEDIKIPYDQQYEEYEEEPEEETKYNPLFTKKISNFSKILYAGMGIVLVSKLF
jgi:hypothetical protein